MATPTALPLSFTAGQVLTAADTNLLRGAFRILQVVQGSTSTAVASSSATLADTGLTATITPLYNTSKILVFVTHPQCAKTLGNGFNCIKMALLRGATNIQAITDIAGYTGTGADMYFSISSLYLDSPATISATTYKTQFASKFATAQVEVQAQSTSQSTIILCEVSA